MTRLVAVVEGRGEVAAVPMLRRIGLERGLDPALHALKPIRVSRPKLVRPPGDGHDEVARVVRLAVGTLRGRDGVLVLVDADEDEPLGLERDLRRRGTPPAGDVPLAVVAATREYASWFLAAAASLAGRRGLPAVLHDHPDPESVRGAKEWLSRRMRPQGEGRGSPRSAAELLARTGDRTTMTRGRILQADPELTRAEPL